jgi:hypothetical protein
LHQATSENAQVAPSLREAAISLRGQDYSAVVIDQSALDLDPDESSAVLQHLGTAVPVYVNFGINSTERVVRELRIALQRRETEGQIVRQVVERQLRSELKSTATAILVSCEMALKSPELSAPAQTKMETVRELAQQICGKLGVAE